LIVERKRICNCWTMLQQLMGSNTSFWKMHPTPGQFKINNSSIKC
jgi:hypothetical protein